MSDGVDGVRLAPGGRARGRDLPDQGVGRHGPWPGVPRAGDLGRDALAGARAQLATTFTLALVMATACFAVLVTTGQAAANEARVVEEVDSAGTRLIALSDDGGAAGILPEAPGRLAALSDVTWALGLGAAADVTNPALPTGRAAARPMVGELLADVLLVRGRRPQPGEAIVGSTAAAALSLGPGLGRVEAKDGAAAGIGSAPIAVVGVFDATGPLAFLDDVVLVAVEPGDLDTLRYVYVMARDAAVVDRLESVLASSTPALHTTALTVETPRGAIALRDVIAGRLGAASRQLMALIMGVGAVIIAVTVLSAVVARRRDLGRRRALGATRSTLVATLLGQVTVGVVAGVGVGVGAGLAVLAATTGSWPTWRFVVGVAGLSVLVALVTAAPIATYAAYRDPLRILRVP